MKTLVICGNQWGDEGKGKITDYFSQKADFVVRWAGGDNAGHSVKFNNKKYALSAIPSGIFNKNTINVIASGCVVNLKKIISEIEYLKENKFNVKNLWISDRCHLIFPYHLLIDEQQEKYRQEAAIGTTKKGIGPAYQDKAERIGIRMCDLFDKKTFIQKIENNLKFKNEVFTKIYHCEPMDPKKIIEEYLILFEKIKPFVCDTTQLINKAILENKKVLFEGAQGSLLDINFGSYPFVTSSHPIASSIPCEVGISPKYIQNVLGIVKAYSTRVGAGAFPSEIEPELASIIREEGHEYGVVSGRPRRIGWLDLVALKYSFQISGTTHLAIMLLDVLKVVDEIKICVAYKLDGKEIDYIPAATSVNERCEPIYITVPGFKGCNFDKVSKYEDLPKNAQSYLKLIEQKLGLPIALISFGADRSQTILMNEDLL